MPLVLALLMTLAAPADKPKLELKDGDRIVYLGNAFVENDQKYGYLETMLTTLFPQIRVGRFLMKIVWHVH